MKRPSRKPRSPPAASRRLAQVQARLRQLREELEVERQFSEGFLESQRELEVSRERYAHLYDHAPVGYLTLDGNGLIHELNLAAAEMFGEERASIVGRPLHGFVTKADRRAVLRHLAALRRGESGVVTELTLAGKGANVRTVELRALRAHPEAGSRHAHRYFAVLTDITARKQAETEVQRLAAQRQLALDAARLGWWQYDPVTRVALWDDRYKAIFGLTGYSRHYDEFLRQTVHPEDLPALRTRIEAALNPADPQPLVAEYRINRPDGQMRWVEAHAVATFEGDGAARRAVSLVGTVADITERRAAEQAVRAAEELARQRLAELEDLYVNAPVGLCVLDCNLRYLRINERAAKINGIPAAAHIGKTVRELMPQLADAIEPELRRVLATGEPKLNIEVVSETPAQPGVLRNSLLQWLPTKDAQGRVTGLSIVVEETTERKTAEAALRQSREDLDRAQVVGHIGWWRLDTRKNVLTWSEENYCIFGVPKGTPLTYETFLAVVHPDDRQYVDARWQAALRGEPYDIEHRIVADGQVKWVREKAYLEFDSDGQLLGGFGITQDITARKLAEEALRRSERRYRSFIEVTSQFAWVTDPAGLVVEDIPALRAFTGQTYEQAKGEGWAKALHPDDLQRTLEVWNRAVSTRTPYEIEHRMRRHDGVYRLMLARGVPIMDDEGRVLEWVGTCIDVTERRAAEKALRESELFYRQTLESIPGMVFTTRTDGYCDYQSQQWVDYTGIPMSEHLGDGWNKLLHPEDRPRALAAWRAAIEGRAPYDLEYRVRRHDGAYEWFKVIGRPIRDASGQIVRWLGVALNIEDLKQAEEALRQSEERFRVAQELSPDGFAILRPVRDAEGQVVDFIWVYENEAMARLNGTDPKAVLGRRLLEIFLDHWQTQFLRVYKQVAETGQRCVFEEQYSGDRRSKPAWLRVAVVPIGKDIAVQAQDITRQKEFEAELRRLVAQRTAKLEELVAELEHFSYSITHDMRAPLRAMHGLAELMESKCEGCEKEDTKYFLQRIRVAAARMDALITDALSYSQAVRRDLPLSPVDPGALLRGMLDTYPEFQQSKAQIEIRGEIPPVIGNEAGLTQCFSNLLGNAVKYVKPGQIPEIRIWAEVRHGVETRGSADPANRKMVAERVRIWVEDQGIGIPKLMQPRVFDMFSRGHNTYEGTGIGLALVRKVVQQMGGNVGVESEPGVGSRFWLELERADTGKGSARN